jgi:type II secretory pathway component PulM
MKRSDHGSARGAGMRFGFNLLPWRQREMHRLLWRRVFEWCAAALLGCVCVAPLVGWQLWARGQADARREVVEQAVQRLRSPLADANRLASEATAQRVAAGLAQQHAKPLKRLLALFDGLASAGIAGVALQQVAQRGDEAELQAEAANESAVAEWLGQLRALPEVDAVSVRELKRASPAAGAKAGAKAAAAGNEPIHVLARVVWKGASATPAKPTSESRQGKLRSQK